MTNLPSAEKGPIAETLLDFGRDIVMMTFLKYPDSSKLWKLKNKHQLTQNYRSHSGEWSKITERNRAF
jgi:hypothetical protein